MTCTNGEGCGEVVPGTGIHLNNMMGEQDLSPFGFHAHPPGRRLPSMMAPTMVLGDGGPRLVLGSAGSNRIRSAILQVVIGVLDHGLDVQAAIDAPRVHFEEGVVYVEPGVDTAGLEAERRTLVRFAARNLFFGGAQAVLRDPAGGGLRAAATRAAAAPWRSPDRRGLEPLDELELLVEPDELEHAHHVRGRTDDDEAGAVHARVLARLEDQPDPGRVHERELAQVEHELRARAQVEAEHALVRLVGAGTSSSPDSARTTCGRRPSSDPSPAVTACSFPRVLRYAA